MVSNDVEMQGEEIYPVAPNPTVTPPSPADQLKEININESLEKGVTYYLLSDKWWTNFQRYCRLTDSLEDRSNHPGIIDNSYLFETFGKMTLRSHLVDRLHYVLVSETQWKKLVDWYGVEHPPIPRQVIELGRSSLLQVEVYLRKIQITLANDQTKKNVYDVEISRATSVGNLKKLACDRFHLPCDDTTRLKKEFAGQETVINDLNAAIEDTFDTYLSEKVILEAQENGAWPEPVSTYSSTSSSFGTYPYSNSSSSSYSSPPTYSTTFGSSNSNYGSGSSSSSFGYSGASSSSYSSSNFSSGSSSSNSYFDYGSSRSTLVKGATGLGNLGNTCFMNSAIQCLSNTAPLTKHFLSGKYSSEVNTTNPLGMGGKIATEFGGLMTELWSGNHSSVSPRDLKWTIGKFAPQFSGYAQHDSQELLAFLLDGLHEDLNRIVKKPYVEIKDSAGRPDEVVAQETWDGHKLRNDSIISDIFQGQFKSKVTCPTCPKVSVTFDPFMYLSLPLPTIDTRALVVAVVKKDLTSRPIQLRLRLPKKGTVILLRDQVSQMLDIPKELLVTAEVYDHRFHITYNTQSNLKDIRDDDEIVLYETETPYKAPLDESDEHLINIKVLIQVRSQMQSYSSYRSNLTKNIGLPLYITVKRGINYQELYETIKNHLSRFAQLPEEKEEPSASASTDALQTDDEATLEMDVDPKGEDEELEKLGQKIDKARDPEGEGELKEPSKKLKPHFTLQTSRSYSSSTEELDNSGRPLSLRENAEVCAVWDRDEFDAVFKEEDFTKCESHPSMTEKAEGDKVDLSVESSLKMFLKEEKLGEDNTWFCPQCKEDRQAMKKFDLWRLPEVMIIHLKRFSYSSFSRDKIDSFVDFPLTDLDFTNYASGPQEIPPIYDLFAVSNHYGGMGGGHYTAYAKNHVDNNWYNFDDSSVRKVDAESVKTSAAYVLFYKRRGIDNDSDTENGTNSTNGTNGTNGTSDETEMENGANGIDDRD